MAEMYAKPFESVQAAITLFEQKIDPKRFNTGSNKEEKEGEFLKDLTNCRMLLEAKEHEKDLAFFEFNASPKSPEELLTWLKLYKAERDKYKENFRKAQALFLEFEKREHFFHSVGNLKSEEALHFKKQFTVAYESITAAQQQAEMIIVEKEKRQELLMHTSEIKKAILSAQPSNVEVEKHSSAFVTRMEEDLQVPEAEVFQSQIQLEVLRRQLDVIEDLESELWKQMIISEYLHMELKQSKEAQAIFSKTVLNAMNELDLVKSENEQMKQVNSEGANCILEIEEEGKRMKEELNISSEKINGINCQIDIVGEIQRMQEEMSKSKKKVLELQAKVTTLTSKLHNSSIRIAPAEESEARSMCARAGLNQAMHQLAVEAEEAKTEVQRLAEYNKAETENEFLIQKSEMANDTKNEPNDGYEVNKLKRELEDKNAEISELTCKLEKTVMRAELAEKAKLVVENQLRMWREKQRLRRAASDALKGHADKNHEANRQHEKPFLSKLACIKPEPHDIPSRPKKSVSVRDGRQSKYVTLGKLLKIKL